MLEDNENLKEFYRDIDETLHLISINESDIIYFSEDNSFGTFLRNFVMSLADDIEAAILDKDVSVDKDLRNKMNRYFNVLTEAVDYRILNKELIKTFKKVHVLIDNWMNMIRASDLLSPFCLDEADIQRFTSLTQRLNRIMDGSTTLQNLIEVVSKLIIKAEQVLAASPRAFDISKSYFDALKKEIENDISQ